MRRVKQDPMQWGDDRCAGMTAAIYVRKSTVTEGRSKSRDEQLELGYLDAERFGFGKVLSFVEEEGQKGEWWWADREGRNPGPHRPELTRLIDAIERGEVNSVVVYKQDRLVRDAGVGDALSKLFRKHNVRLITKGRDSEIDTARGLYQVSIDSAAARQWRDQISEDICRDHDHKFKLHMFTRNPSCFGFRSCGRDSQAVRPVYEELGIVKRIYQMFLGIGTQALGPYQIARQLEREGVRTATGSKGHKAKKPEKVHGTCIKQILQNPMYAGYWVHNGEMAFYERLLIPPASGEGESAPAIPEEWYDAAVAKLANQPKTGRKAAGDLRPLSGLAVCGACGRPMNLNIKYLKEGGTTRRWICPHREGPTRDCWGESYASIVEDELNDWAVKYLAPYLADELTAMAREADGSSLQLDLSKVKQELMQLKEVEARQLRGALVSLDEEQFAALAQTLRSERQALEQRVLELDRVVAHTRERVDCDVNLDSSDPASLKAAFSRLIRWVAVTDRGIAVLTAMGTYMGATFIERNKQIKGVKENRRKPAEPTLASVASCSSWIADPKRFVEGRRYALAHGANHMTDEELLPGVWERFKENDAA